MKEKNIFLQNKLYNHSITQEKKASWGQKAFEIVFLFSYFQLILLPFII